MISGLPESTLRYYEQIGIIAPIARDPSSGHRAYTDEDIQSLVTISCLSATGMPLDAMREYLKNRFDGAEGAHRQMALLDAQALRLAAKAESIRIQQAYVSLKTLYWRAVAEGHDDEAQRLLEENHKGVKQMACEEHAEPTIIDGGDAIIRVVRACVCGSDLWFYRDGSKEPNTQAGHEAIGVVEQIGDDVTVVKPGDFVIVPFPFSCGKCPVCKAGFESSCPHGGYFGDEGLGCQAEYLRVPEANGTLVVVPGDVKSFSDEMLASLLTLSDVMSTGYHAAASAEIKPGDTAVVFGDGAVGLCGVLSAKLMGATRIISMSRHADRQRIAREFGATDFVEERGDEAVAKVLEMTDGYGADAVLECVGSALSNDTAMKVARAGAMVGRVGLPHGVEADIPGLFYRNVGLRGGPAPVRTYDLQRLLKEVLDGNINPGIVYTSEYTLDDIQEAYAAMDERRTVKSLLRISEV